jgi:hypothetical protein
MGEWFAVKNASGEIVPSGALARVTGLSDGCLTVEKPDADSDADLVVVDARAQIPADDTATGQASYANRVVVAYDEADGTPAAGEEWGSAAGEWKLRSGKSGFLILGGAGKGLVNAVRKRGSPTVPATSWRSPVRAATTAALPACTYANGSSGVGATLTGTADGALAAQDGVTLGLDDALLVKDQATGAQKGIYTLTQVGDASHPFVLTRRSDCDTADELLGACVAVEEGSTNADTLWLSTADATITVGTTALPWTQIGTGSSSGVTVQEADGSPSYTASATLQFDSADGFVVSQPSSGVARVDFAAATTAQAGGVSTSAQTWSGTKTVEVPGPNQTGFVASYLAGGYKGELTAGGLTLTIKITGTAYACTLNMTANGAQIATDFAAFILTTSDGTGTPAYKVVHSSTLFSGQTGALPGGGVVKGGIVTTLPSAGASGTDPVGNVVATGVVTSVGAGGVTDTINFADGTSLTFTKGILTSWAGPP